ITVTNRGPDEAVDVRLDDFLPRGTAFVSLAPPAGWTTTTMPPFTDRFTATTPRLAAGAVARVTLVLRATGFPDNLGGPPLYCDRAGAPPPTPGDSINNIGSGFVRGAVADVAVSVAGAPGSVGLGQDITYTVAVDNRGPSDVPAATLAVTLPSGVTFGSATTS